MLRISVIVQGFVDACGFGNDKELVTNAVGGEVVKGEGSDGD